MTTPFHVIIPARFASTRLPGKLLMDLEGKSILERVYTQALKSGALSVTIATDSDDIYQRALSFGAKVLMTSSTHQSGTDRIAEVVRLGGFEPDAVIVNVQGDEPLIAPELIRQVAKGLVDSHAPASTLCWPVASQAELFNPNIVKVVRNCRKEALYFSRSPIPLHRDSPSAIEHCFRHIGLYAYRAAFLLDMTKLKVSPIEGIEMLEQLRVLWAGFAIYVDDACVRPLQDINTADDLERARDYIKTGVLHHVIQRTVD